MFYARGVFINKCYDELNLSQPEMVRSVHEEYLQAAAEVKVDKYVRGERHFG